MYARIHLKLNGMYPKSWTNNAYGVAYVHENEIGKLQNSNNILIRIIMSFHIFQKHLLF